MYFSHVLTHEGPFAVTRGDRALGPPTAATEELGTPAARSTNARPTDTFTVGYADKYDAVPRLNAAPAIYTVDSTLSPK